MRSLLAITVGLPWLCFTVAAQVVSPANPVVQAGQTLQFTANRPVTWSLAPGSAGTMDSGGLYHAPATVQVAKSLGGCQIGPPDCFVDEDPSMLRIFDPLHHEETILRLNQAWL
jgi:hypothetical protein